MYVLLISNLTCDNVNTMILQRFQIQLTQTNVIILDNLDLLNTLNPAEPTWLSECCFASGRTSRKHEQLWCGSVGSNDCQPR